MSKIISYIKTIILNITGTTDSSNTATGSLICAGGVGVAKKLNVGSDTAIGGGLTVNGTNTANTSLLGNITNTNTYNLNVSGIMNGANATISSMSNLNVPLNFYLNSGTILTDAYNAYLSIGTNKYGYGTTTNLYNLYLASGSNQNISGVITNGHGLYVNTPAYGSTKYNSYFKCTGSKSYIDGAGNINFNAGLSQDIGDPTNSTSTAFLNSLSVFGMLGLKNQTSGIATWLTGSPSQASNITYSLPPSKPPISAFVSLNSSGEFIANSISYSPVQVADTTDCSGYTNGSFHTDGGMSCTKQLAVGSNISTWGGLWVTNPIYCQSTTDSTSTSTGSFICSGGAGIAKKMYVGQQTYLQGGLITTGTRDISIASNDGQVNNTFIGYDSTIEKFVNIGSNYNTSSVALFSGPSGCIDLRGKVGIKNNGSFQSDTYTNLFQIGSTGSGTIGFSQGMAHSYVRFRETGDFNLFAITTNISALGVQDSASYPSWQMYLGNDFFRIYRCPAGNPTFTQLFEINNTGFASASNITPNVVQSTATGGSGTTSTTWVSTIFTASITPKRTTSKIKITFNSVLWNNVAGYVGCVTIYRGTTELSGQSQGFACTYNIANVTIPISLCYLDSPATTSSTTYTIYIKSTDANLNTSVGSGNIKSVLLLEEVYT